MYNLLKSIRFNNYIINIFDVPFDKIYNENVHCINSLDGSVLWVIESKRSKNDNSPYVNIYIKDNKLYAVNYDGWTEEIDINIGKIINSRFTK